MGKHPSRTRRPRLFLTVGLPGAGKSTRARAWVAVDPEHRARVNRDDLRAMLQGGRLGTRAQEQQVTAAQHAAVRALLKEGVDVIVDDTNLVAAHREALVAIGHECGARVRTWDLLHVPVEECLRRNAGRTGPARLPDEVILALAAQA